MSHRGIPVVVALVLAIRAPGRVPVRADPAPAAPPDIVAQIDALVRSRFYAPAVLPQRGWDAAVREARAALIGAGAARRTEILSRLVARLATSHTDYVPPDSPRYAQLLSIFDEILPRATDRCPDLSKLPPLPVEVPDVGVWWTQHGDRWFVGGVLDGGPARAAGLVLGDEVVTADGRAFQPVAAFAGKPGKVALAVRRSSAGALRTVAVEPRRVRPQAAFRDAIGASARIIEHRGARIAYVRVWSWAGADMQDALEDAISVLNGKRPTGFVIDLRDGWGGASPDYLRIFDPRIPVIEFVERDGTRGRTDRHIHAPAVVLINGGSRSGKEVIAYGVKKHHLAKLVGERTGGAVVAGGIYCLDDGALLYLASSAVTIDGEVLEGKGVEPDLTVAFDVRYAAGRDRQLEAALDQLVAP
jgi:carboxyl-terminal processing protease